MILDYKGYRVSQSDYNNHVMIAKDGHMVMHASCTKKLSEKELQEEVDNYIALVAQLAVEERNL
jgi:hypothetical protein